MEVNLWLNSGEAVTVVMDEYNSLEAVVLTIQAAGGAWQKEENIFYPYHAITRIQIG